MRDCGLSGDSSQLSNWARPKAVNPCATMLTSPFRLSTYIRCVTSVASKYRVACRRIVGCRHANVGRLISFPWYLKALETVETLGTLEALETFETL